MLKAGFNRECGIIREDRVKEEAENLPLSSLIAALCMDVFLDPLYPTQVFDSPPCALLSVGVCGWE